MSRRSFCCGSVVRCFRFCCGSLFGRRCTTTTREGCKTCLWVCAEPILPGLPYLSSSCEQTRSKAKPFLFKVEGRIIIIYNRDRMELVILHLQRSWRQESRAVGSYRGGWFVATAAALLCSSLVPRERTDLNHHLS